ncbi:MAG: 6,7-dimethyl-8-ribityllumazine synthase [Alphaproteobacteria bacterium]|nr:6,7-dimethyl-8-ribityllumazine synthase [Alphaproteobacteria bacterium]
MNQIAQTPKPKTALIQASWHFDIVDKCRQGLIDELSQNGWLASDVEIFKVPGAFDIPLLARRLAQTGAYSAIVASGFVVDGGIYRHDFVAATVIDALMQVQLETDVPVLSAVLTPHQFQETGPHIAFFQEHFVTKGKEAAEAVMMITGTFARLAAA